MMANQPLADKDINAALPGQQPPVGDLKSMEYHRQVLQNKMAQEPAQQYVSPSDDIMSPCTAKINALRNKHVAKAKPRSLFAQASAKKLHGESTLGSDPARRE